MKGLTAAVTKAHHREVFPYFKASKSDGVKWQVSGARRHGHPKPGKPNKPDISDISVVTEISDINASWN
jgi:hypothetical protein